jgi:pantoate--beta-alanine ligase
MLICRTIPQMRAAVAGFRAGGKTVGLVPTMGALHPGHLALVAAARAQADCVVATIFVNPTQFGQAADLAAYPRPEARDLALLREAGVDAVFIPTVAEIYPEGAETIVETTHLAHVFHGAVRPGHFRGVATVVTKLFNIIAADVACFGEKDYQQLAVIRRMARDLHLPIHIHGVPTLRDADGLAMSSRNTRLGPKDRAAAVVLNRALDSAMHLAATGAMVEDLAQAIRATIIAEPRARLRACDIVWADSFAIASGPLTTRIGIMISAEFGPPDTPVLLIDQREIAPLEG